MYPEVFVIHVKLHGIKLIVSDLGAPGNPYKQGAQRRIRDRRSVQ